MSTETVPSLLHSLGIQRRVLHALLMREIITRFGRENLGVLWLVAEPMLLPRPHLIEARTSAGRWRRQRVRPPGVLGHIEAGSGISSAGAVSGTQHDVVDVVGSRGGSDRSGSLLVDLDVPCR